MNMGCANLSGKLPEVLLQSLRRCSPVCEDKKSRRKIGFQFCKFRWLARRHMLLTNIGLVRLPIALAHGAKPHTAFHSFLHLGAIEISFDLDYRVDDFDGEELPSVR